MSRCSNRFQETEPEPRDALEHQLRLPRRRYHQPLADGRAAGVDAIVESAARFCAIEDLVLRLRDGDTYGSAGSFWSFISIRLVARSVYMSHRYRWMRDHGTLHVPDTRSQDDFPRLGSISGWRTFLGVPLRQQGEFIGGLFGRRIDVRPFTPAQIKLLETFADQAVIAIENVRLFNELEGVVGAANGDERDFGRDRQLTDGYTASAEYDRRKRRKGVQVRMTLSGSDLSKEPYSPIGQHTAAQFRCPCSIRTAD